MEGLVATAIGIGLLSVALGDVWHTLFHPSGRGRLSRVLSSLVWSAFQRFTSRSSLTLAGPTIMMAVIASWVALVALGWALIYWPQMDTGFAFAPGLQEGQRQDFVDALYLSLVTLSTLGFGDITPTENFLRLLAPLQALTGFGLLTASLSWVISVYPVLSRQRALAHMLILLRDGKFAERVSENSHLRLETLSEITARIIVVRGDLVQFPVSYYFHNPDERASLPAVALYLPELISQAEDDWQEEAQLRAQLLQTSIEDLAALLSSQFLSTRPETARNVLAAYAKDHLY